MNGTATKTALQRATGMSEVFASGVSVGKKLRIASKAPKFKTKLSCTPGGLIPIREVARLLGVHVKTACKRLREWEACGWMEHRDDHPSDMFPKNRVIEIIDSGLHVD